MEEGNRGCGLLGWPEADAVEASLQRLRDSLEGGAFQNRLLGEITDHLTVRSSAHKHFVLAGGVQVPLCLHCFLRKRGRVFSELCWLGVQDLCGFLTSSSTSVLNNCMGALQALAFNEDVRSELLETVIAEKMFNAVRTNRSKRSASIRRMAGTIIKLLAGVGGTLERWAS